MARKTFGTSTETVPYGTLRSKNDRLTIFSKANANYLNCNLIKLFEKVLLSGWFGLAKSNKTCSFIYFPMRKWHSIVDASTKSVWMQNFIVFQMDFAFKSRKNIFSANKRPRNYGKLVRILFKNHIRLENLQVNDDFIGKRRVLHEHICASESAEIFAFPYKCTGRDNRLNNIHADNIYANM